MPHDDFDPGSFRDHTARIFHRNGNVYRALSAEALEQWQALRGSRLLQDFQESGKIVKTEAADLDSEDLASLPGDWVAVLQHSVIPFISYPYEWSFGMLKECAILQLELLRRSIAEDLILKDSTPYNFQWQGAFPVFIDIASFEKLNPGEPWVGYRQFCQLFLFPLLLEAYKQVSFQPWLRGSLEGIEPMDFLSVMSFRDLFRAGVFTHGFLQAKAEQRYAQTDRDVKADLKSAGFRRELILSNIRRLEKLVRRLDWKKRRSTWSEYAECNSYQEQDREMKVAFVSDIVHTRPWKLAWDLGCNTGRFSRIAAENAGYVVAVDADHLAVERLYQQLKSEDNRSILPLVGNLADPSPGLGWRNLERATLAERGKPDLILFLALIHHLAITANIPLLELVQWLASLGSDIVIEFVSKQDAMVQKLLRNKVDQYPDYEKSIFESLLKRYFRVEKSQELHSGTRTLYFASASP